MPKKRKPKPDESDSGQGEVVVDAYVLDRLFDLVNSHKKANPSTSNAARLFNRGAPQIAKKVGEEAIEALIEGFAGNESNLVSESADLIYYLMALWAACGVKPKAVWDNIAARESLRADA